MIYPFSIYYKIIDQEEQKGRLSSRTNGLGVSYGLEVCKLSKELKNKRTELRDFKKSAIEAKECKKKNSMREDSSISRKKRLSKKSVAYQRKVEMLNLEILLLKKDLTDAKHNEIDAIAQKIESGKIKLGLVKSQARGKDVYTYKDLPTFLACKIVMLELRKQYHIYPANRNDIVDVLTVHFQGKIKYGIVRSDIKHFFETIPQVKLIEKLSDDGKVSSLVLRYIKRVLYEYNKMTNGTTLGLPRGICFSSYLAEIYLNRFDQCVKETKGVLFYRRFVDDIIILTIPPLSPSEMNKKMENLLNNIDLQVHYEEKSLVKEMYEGADKIEFDYLGYHFQVKWGQVSVSLSAKKIQKYILLLNQIFRIYGLCKNNYKKKRSPLKEFISRLAVLTSNGNLNGRKNFVKTGIYYSNKMLTNLSDLEKLDNFLANLLNDRNNFSVPQSLFNRDKDYTEQMNTFVKNIKKKYSFVEAFKSRRMYSHSDFAKVQEDLKHIYLAH